MSNESLEEFFRKSHFEDELPSRNLQKLEKQLSSVIWNARRESSQHTCHYYLIYALHTKTIPSDICSFAYGIRRIY